MTAWSWLQTTLIPPLQKSTISAALKFEWILEFFRHRMYDYAEDISVLLEKCKLSTSEPEVIRSK